MPAQLLECQTPAAQTPAAHCKWLTATQIVTLCNLTTKKPRAGSASALLKSPAFSDAAAAAAAAAAAQLLVIRCQHSPKYCQPLQSDPQLPAMGAAACRLRQPSRLAARGSSTIHGPNPAAVAGHRFVSSSACTHPQPVSTWPQYPQCAMASPRYSASSCQHSSCRSQ